MDLTPDLAAALKRHATWLRAEALRTGTGEPEWLFPKVDGTLMDKNHAAAVFRRLLKRAGLPHYRVYDLRHTFASLLLAEGAPITYVAAQLGHSSPATTLRYHATWIPSKGRRWVNSLDRRASRDPGTGSAAPTAAAMEPESRTSEKGTAEVSEKVGSPGWSRTSDFLINSQALYQLSYRGVTSDLDESHYSPRLAPCLLLRHDARRGPPRHRRRGDRR